MRRDRSALALLPGRLALSRRTEVRRLATAGTLLELDAAPALRTLPAEARERLAEQAERVEARRGELVLVEGRPADEVLLPVEGELQVHEAGEGSARVGLMTTLGPGALVGEVGVLAGRPRTASVLALRPSRLLRLPAPAFLEALGADDEAARVVARQAQEALAPRRLTSSGRNPAGAAPRPAAYGARVTQPYRSEPDVHPPLASPDYASTRLRAPLRPPVALPQRLTEITGPLLGEGRVSDLDSDLTRQSDGEPIGQRILVSGQVRDSDGRPVPSALVEVWQANSAGRYAHERDQWPAPLDPHFAGLGRTLTDEQGRYSFTTIRPGAYPWGNHHNAWRPAHIHFSLFGRAFTQRLVTQMYFPDDPLMAYDPIALSVPEPARGRLVSAFSMAGTKPDWALAYDFDIVLRGRGAVPFEEPHA